MSIEFSGDGIEENKVVFDRLLDSLSDLWQYTDSAHN